jgi:phosphoribosyl 1,2-cyclic phosphate phosphodiesterase
MPQKYDYFCNFAVMKILFLGTGTSTGVPQMAGDCAVCQSTDSKDKRLRSSALISDGDNSLLIDCGPDFRQQVLMHRIKKVSNILFTHEHYDHISGLDEVRPFRAVDVYAEKRLLDVLVHNLPYIFKSTYPGAPTINLNEIQKFNSTFQVSGFEVLPVRLMHHKLPVLGYRINNFAYVTDFSAIDESEMEKLKGLDVLAIDALRVFPHPAHLTLDQALELVEKLQPKRAYFIHMSHDMGLHEELQKTLTENVFLAYDGLEITV